MTDLLRKQFIGAALLIFCATWIPTREEKISILVKTDTRVELMSILFRMAVNPESRMGRIASYVQNVEKYFERSKEQDAVKLASTLRETRGISYDTVMGLAVHVTDGAEGWVTTSNGQ